VDRLLEPADVTPERVPGNDRLVQAREARTGVIQDQPIVIVGGQETGGRGVDLPEPIDGRDLRHGSLSLGGPDRADRQAEGSTAPARSASGLAVRGPPGHPSRPVYGRTRCWATARQDIMKGRMRRRHLAEGGRSMAINFACACGKQYVVRDDLAG